jgi:hypothetical protein
MRQIIVLSSSHRTRKLMALAGSAIAVISFVAIVVLASRWPFTRQAVVRELEAASLTKVDIGTYHGTYFPRPGCVLEHVTFRHNPRLGTPPLITVERLRIEGSFSGLFRRQVKGVHAEGMRLLIPPPDGDEHFKTPKRSAFMINELIADGAILEVASRQSGQPPLKFVFQRFALYDVGSNGPASFQAKFSNPEPPGEIITNGTFGPWSETDVGKTAVAGEYLFQQADLGVFPGIAGLLSSSGKFSGVLNHIEVQGLTDTPSFTVTSSSHQVQLQTKFHAVVNGENGDTFLQDVAATFGKTTVSSVGSVAGRPGQSGKTASFELAVNEGRIQDLLLLFARSKRAPMSGIVGFHTKVDIPPGDRPFLAKVKLQGDFGINAGSFAKGETQNGVNRLSDSSLRAGNHQSTPKDEDSPETVLSDLKGHVELDNGTARLSNLSFSVPGALAQMHGTYNLISEKIDLHGTLEMHSEPSDATQGIKAVMLRVLDPFFKKKPIGYVMPVEITGTYSHPSFGLDLGGHDERKPHKQSARVSRILGESAR